MKYLFFHAHPDDETLSSGAIICALIAEGHECLVLTATRGERGQAVPESVPPGGDLVEVRMGERARALVALGARDAGWLGEGPNRAGGCRRIYCDSGMDSPRPPEDSFCGAEMAEIVADLEAALIHHQPDVLVSYDAAGGYGHRDHIRCHEAALAAATAIGLAFCEIVTPAWYDVSGHEGRLRAAHEAYRSQFSLGGDTIVHVGGQTCSILRAGGLLRHYG